MTEKELTAAQKAALIEKRSAREIEWHLQMNREHKERNAATEAAEPMHIEPGAHPLAGVISDEEIVQDIALLHQEHAAYCREAADKTAARLQREIAAGFMGCPHCVMMINPKYGKPCFEATPSCPVIARQRADQQAHPVQITPEVLEKRRKLIEKTARTTLLTDLMKGQWRLDDIRERHRRERDRGVKS